MNIERTLSSFVWRLTLAADALCSSNQDSELQLRHETVYRVFGWNCKQSATGGKQIVRKRGETETGGMTMLISRGEGWGLVDVDGIDMGGDDRAYLLRVICSTATHHLQVWRLQCLTSEKQKKAFCLLCESSGEKATLMSNVKMCCQTE